MRKKQTNMTFEDLLTETKGDVDKAVELFLKSNVLITVPHAYTKIDINHSYDKTALENARKLHKQKPLSLLHIGNVDRRDADLNRKTKPLSFEYHYFIKLWIKLHPGGELIDVHSYPPGFNWRNPTTTLSEEFITTDELVVLLPVKNKEYARSWKDMGGRPILYLQGSEDNYIINMECKKSVLLEFNEITA